MKNDYLNLKNKNILLTGCNGYVGRAITNKLVNFGANVIGTDIKKQSPNSKLKKFIKADLSDKIQVVEFINYLKKNLNKIDGLINNAGYVGTSKIEEKNFDKIFYNEAYENLNLTSTIYLTNSLVSFFKKSKSASIINICSIYSTLAYDYSLYTNTNMKTPMAYGVSKAGLMHYSKMLSSTVAPKIRVNSISPGGIYRKQPKSFVKKYLSKTSLSRMCHENDVANAVIFLLSDLSSYITGQNLIVDGGYSNT